MVAADGSADALQTLVFSHKVSKIRKRISRVQSMHEVAKRVTNYIPSPNPQKRIRLTDEVITDVIDDEVMMK